LTVRIKFSGEGEVTVNYYFRDEGRYGVILSDRQIILEKEERGERTHIGSTPAPGIRDNTWIDLKVIADGSQHQVFVGEALVLTAADAQPLETGAILLQAFGELTVEFDDLEVKGTPPGPPHEAPDPEQEPRSPDAGQPSPAPRATTADTPDSIVQEFFASQASGVELTTFAINLALAAICSYMLGLAYIHWGASLSNRRKFAPNFVLMAVTTTFIILVVRSSVALSLGLVGALSIVRFRTVVKEAEELAYLFLAIGLGIGLGDNQRLITLLALAGAIVIIGLLRLLRRSQADVNLHLTVTSHGSDKLELDDVLEALRAHTTKLGLLRFDENQETLEAAFVIEFKEMSSLSAAKASLRALSDSVEITFVDSKGLW
jgi:hypothetical protein